MELLRPTAGDDAAPADEVETEGRGVAAAEPSSSKGKKIAPRKKTKARNIRLSDDVHDRLWLLARDRRQTVSAVADHELNKILPRYDVKRQKARQVETETDAA